MAYHDDKDLARTLALEAIQENNLSSLHVSATLDIDKPETIKNFNVFSKLLADAFRKGAASTELTVTYGAMPESNGKSNFTATLRRKGSSFFDPDQYAFSRSEYPDRVRYDADFMRYLIGERAERPELWDKEYDTDKRSDYVDPHAGAKLASHDVLAERRRQVYAEHYDPEHDDTHKLGEIAAYAAYYAMPPGVRAWPATETGYGDTFGEAIVPDGWTPKPTDDRRRELVKAGALILAEIERFDREVARAAQKVAQ